MTKLRLRTVGSFDGFLHFTDRFLLLGEALVDRRRNRLVLLFERIRFFLGGAKHRRIELSSELGLHHLGKLVNGPPAPRENGHTDGDDSRPDFVDVAEKLRPRLGVLR